MFRNAEIKSEIVDLRLDFQLKYAVKKIFICIFVSLFVFYSFIFIPAASPAVSTLGLLIYFLCSLFTTYWIFKSIYLLFWTIKNNKFKIIIEGSNFRIENPRGIDSCCISDINSIKFIFRSFLYIKTAEYRYLVPLYAFSRKNYEIFHHSFEKTILPGDRLLNLSYDLAESVFIALVIALHVMQFFIGKFYIPTSSMRETLIEGDYIFAEKISYGFNMPRLFFMDSPKKIRPFLFPRIKRGDVVIFRPLSPGDEKREYVKRCIAVEGDKVELKDDSVYLNGIKLDEPYANGKTNYDIYETGKIDGIVPKDMILLLGDNREDSQDSRYFGYVPVERIEGRAFLLFWNSENIKNMDFTRIGLIR
ncbi:MAG TPA: signal peptidase I [Spirochaetota bacterium]|nr:signal peptidase I [Spirochaetota bacterium]HOR44778.1 signal peptidase I [Spirochaetota bacterium]HPK56790.1 signal peptidase I [Spirochaetota bacterium]